MAKDATSDFTNKIVQVVLVMVVVTAVALPIINSMIGESDETTTYPIEEGSMLATLVGIIPVFLILAVLMMVIKTFMDKKSL